MVQGKICPECGYYMYALSEEDEPGGSWILYECRNERLQVPGKSIRRTGTDLSSHR